jgi:transposase
MITCRSVPLPATTHWLWVRQADIDDGHEPGVSTAEAARVRELEQEVRELPRANEILKRAASFFGAELDRQQRR